MATAPLTMADYLRMANTVGEKPGLSYDDYVTLSRLNGTDPSVSGVSGANPGTALGSAYASPDRYNTYQKALGSFMGTDQDQQINAYLDAHPEYLDQVQQQLQQQQAGAGWGVDYNPTSLMNATNGMDPRAAAYQALVQSTYAPIGNPTDNAGMSTTPAFQTHDPYQAWIASLTPSQQAEYDQVVNSNFSKGTSTMRGAFIAVLAAMTAGGALAAMGSTEAVAAGLGAQTGMSASEITAANLAAQTAATVGANAGITAGMTAAEAAAAMDAYVAAGGAASVGTAGLSASEVAAKAAAQKAVEGAATGAGITPGMTAAEAQAAMDAYAAAGGSGVAGANAATDAAMKAAAEKAAGQVASNAGLTEGMTAAERAAAIDAFAKAGGAGAAAGAGGLADYAKQAGDILKKVGGGTDTGGGTGGTGGGINWGSLLGGAGIGAAALAAINGMNNTQGLPTIPDYLKLAEQTSADKTRATNEQTLANRPNQTNAMGDTSQWTKDPVTGAWTQKVAFGAPQQAKFDETNTMLSALRGQIGAGIGKPLDMSAFQTPGANDPYAGVDLSKLQPAGYTPQGSSQIMQDILRTKKVI